METCDDLSKKLKLLFEADVLDRKTINETLIALSNYEIKKEDIFTGKLNISWLLYSKKTIPNFCKLIENLITDDNIRNKEYYRMLLTELYLILGLYSRANYWKKYLKEQKSWNADFPDVSEIKNILETDFIKISYETNLDMDLVKFLTEKIDEVVAENYPAIYPVSHFILIKGKGFSPFFDGIRTAFFMVDTVPKFGVKINWQKSHLLTQCKKK